MGPRAVALSFVLLILAAISLPPAYACGYCSNPPSHQNPHPAPPTRTHPPFRKPPSRSSPGTSPSYRNPPVTIPPPTYTYPPSPPYGGGGGGGGDGGGGGGGLTPPSGGFPGIINPPPSSGPTCSADSLKLGLCLDVLGGLVHVGLGDPVQNVCCPVLGGLLELEAAVCLCTTIKIRLLNITIYLPLALQALITCGKTPPAGFQCIL